MNLVNINDNQTMTSVEIAEMTGKRHDNVIRDIENTIAGISSDLRSGFKSISYKDSNGRNQPCYVMDQDSTILLVTGYDANSRMKVIKRWRELETKQQQMLPQTHIQAVEAYLATLKQVEEQKLKLGIQSEQMKEDAILTEKSQEYYTVKQLRSLVSKPSGVVLSRVSAAMGYEVKSVYSQYDGIASNQYHVDVINAVYGVNL